MINSDITGNFMTKRYTEEKKYSIQIKKQFYRLINLNSMPLRNNSG